MQSVTIEENQAGQRLDKFLHKYLPQAGTSFLYKMLRKKNITLNGKKAEGKEMLSVGDEVKFFFSEETFAKFSGMNTCSDEEDASHNGETFLKENTSGDAGNTKKGGIQNRMSNDTDRIAEYQQAYKNIKNVTVLYEDKHVLIVNKPVGVLSQKAVPKDISLNEWLIGYLLETEAITRQELRTFHPSVCNRLDRNTSGIVLCGKSLAGSQALSRIIKDRSLQKYYHTICVGELTKDEKLEGFLYKDEKTNKVTVCKQLPGTAKDKDYSPIQTGYHPLKWKDGYTLLEVELITGKTHQIRSHLAHIGHPIIGDGKYGSSRVNKRFRESDGLQHQLLHAYRVVFPKDEGVLQKLSGCEIIAPYPALFTKFIENNRLNKV